MNNYEIHLIAYHLLEKLNEENGNCFGTRTLIHLLITIKVAAIKDDNVEHDLEFNNADQMKIEHSARASKSKYGLDFLKNLRLSYKDDKFNVLYELKRKNRDTELREFSFCDIPCVLDSQENLKNRGFNTSPQERHTLKEILKVVFDNGNEVNENKIDEKFTALQRLLKAISKDKKLVQDISNQKPSYGDRYLQTILGAALFYCPTSVKHWDGKISLDAIWNKVKYNINWTKDHINPRRRGAMELMKEFVEKKMNVKDLQNLYRKKLANFTYVTSDENRRLTNYYLEYGNREEALTANGINMIPVKEDDRFRNNAELNRFIEYLRKDRNNEGQFNLNYVENKLKEFRGQ
ncbi:hypothetical protein N8203_04190 [Crocinitomicaceae bacterium]|nr:hypothetical protein [Crocinitomicaceae bacterium]